VHAISSAAFATVVGEAAKTVILKLTNAIKLLNGAGEGCRRDQALQRTLPSPRRTRGHLREMEAVGRVAKTRD